ncbi:MAG: O-antigen ligase family protein [Verrucomicrobiota bacterium]
MKGRALAIATGIFICLPMWLSYSGPLLSLLPISLTCALFLILRRNTLQIRPIELGLSLTLILWSLVSSLWPNTLLFPAAWKELIPDRFIEYFPMTRSPLPIESLLSISILLVGIIVYLSLRSFNRQRSFRYVALCTLVISLALTGGLSLLNHFDPDSFSVWGTKENIGPFPNRNQFAFVLALGMTLSLGLFFRDRSKYRFRSLLWASLTALFVIVILNNGSRAGLLLILTGAMSMTLGWFLLLKKTFSIGPALSIGILALATVLLIGGLSLDRLLQNWNSPEVDGQGRAEIHADAWNMVQAHPILGVGAGQFEAVFPLYRNTFTANKQVVHPESDWLWLSSESGILPILLLLVWGFYFIKESKELPHYRDSYLRLACLSILFLILVHGCIDVSAHRPGSIFPALLALALAPKIRKSGKTHARSNLALGFIVLIVCFCWLFSGFKDLEDSRLNVSSELAKTTTPPIDKLEIVQRALQQNPMSAELYYFHGLAAEGSGAPQSIVDDSFNLAGLLHPYHPEVHRLIGNAYAVSDPEKAVHWWSACLSRSRDLKALEALTLVEENPSPDTRAFLFRMIPEHPELILPLLQTSNLIELAQWKNLILSQEPPSQKNLQLSILQAWERITGASGLLNDVKDYPEWAQHAQLAQARFFGNQGRYEEAATLLSTQLDLESYVPPEVTPEQYQQALRKLTQQKEDVLALLHAGIFEYQKAEHHFALGRFTLLINKESDLPTYTYRLAAESALKTKDWELAYRYLNAFDRSTRR